MTIEKVGEFVGKKKQENALVKISFKIRSSVTGTFIKAPDFEELSKKNFWRIVIEANAAAYSKTKDINLCRIFSGAEFKKLELV
ncbi:MAG: short-chain dehydrogenase [Sphingobacteriales bacterium]|nr:short-chain dehydrogenase [Sphingobacteriales bacterium]